MHRIKHTVSTIAVVIATAGLIAPTAQAKGEAPYPRFAPTEHVTRIVDYVPRTGDRGAWVHDTPLANPVEPKIAPKVVVAGRTTPITGGTDWTFPVMGAVALGLIIMIAGDQIVVRRRGQLAT